MKRLKRKHFVYAGMIAGLLLVVMGALTLFGVFGPEAYYGSSNYKYDSGYTEFGADFYTYVSNNAAEAASASSAAAGNAREIGQMLRTVCGIALIGFGLVTVCGFGLQLPKEPEAVTASAYVPSGESDAPVADEDSAPVETAEKASEEA